MTVQTDMTATPQQVKPRNSSSTLASVNYNLPSDTSPKIIVEEADEKGQNIIHPTYERIEVELNDVSQPQHAPSFAQTGIEFCDYPTQITDFGDDGFRDVYDNEITELLIEVCQAKEAFVFDHTIRDDRSSVRSPARHVHNDYTEQSARTRLYDFLGEETAKAWEADGFAIVNVWRPIGYPVEQSPLCFIDTQSVADSDWVTVDLIYPDRQGQVMGVTYNPTHKWLYLPKMTPTEVAIFRVADSTGKPSVAHSAVDLLEIAENARPRRSIETRVLVRL